MSLKIVIATCRGLNGRKKGKIVKIWPFAAACMHSAREGMQNLSKESIKEIEIHPLKIPPLSLTSVDGRYLNLPFYIERDFKGQEIKFNFTPKSGA